jgi:hypothetical protein
MKKDNTLIINDDLDLMMGYLPHQLSAAEGILKNKK